MARKGMRGSTFAISTDAARSSFTGFVDMLRYDVATVIEDNGSLILLTNEHGPTIARWASFGIYVLACQQWGPRTFVDTRLLKQDALAKLPTSRAPRLPGEPAFG